MHSGHVVTVFSARDYFVGKAHAPDYQREHCARADANEGNDAAMLLLAPDRNGDLRVHPKRISSCSSGIKSAVRQQERLTLSAGVL